MKLHADQHDGTVINAHGPGWISVDGSTYTSSVLVDSRGGCQPWSCLRFEDLGAHDFEPMALALPELVLFGCGATQQFPQPEWLQALFARRIGIEFMDTAAACRTFNLLASERRHVLAALILG